MVFFSYIMDKDFVLQTKVKFLITVYVWGFLRKNMQFLIRVSRWEFQKNVTR
jgi:hypothetical protein